MCDDNNNNQPREAADYEAAATLASLISFSASREETAETYDVPSSESSSSSGDEDDNTTETNDNDAVVVYEEKKKVINSTRKFTRNDEVQLIRGILKYGLSSWKKIWKETPELQHIPHNALKDRNRSKRFKDVLKRAQEDPTLLDRPYELLGAENSHWYESKVSTLLQKIIITKTPTLTNIIQITNHLHRHHHRWHHPQKK